MQLDRRALELYATFRRTCSYKRVKGRSHTVEKRKAIHPQKPHGERRTCSFVPDIPSMGHRPGKHVKRKNEVCHTYGARWQAQRSQCACACVHVQQSRFRCVAFGLHGESSKRLATPRNTKNKKHLQSTQSAQPTNLTDQAPSTTKRTAWETHNNN